MRPRNLSILISVFLVPAGAIVWLNGNRPEPLKHPPASVAALKKVYGGESNQVGDTIPCAVFTHSVPSTFNLDGYAELICKEALGYPSADWRQRLEALAGKPMPGYEKDTSWPAPNFNWEMVELFDFTKASGSTLRNGLDKISPLELYLDMLINNWEGADPAELTKLWDAAFQTTDYHELKAYSILDGGQMGGMVIAGRRKDQTGVFVIFYSD